MRLGPGSPFLSFIRRLSTDTFVPESRTNFLPCEVLVQIEFQNNKDANKNQFLPRRANLTLLLIHMYIILKRYIPQQGEKDLQMTEFRQVPCLNKNIVHYFESCLWAGCIFQLVNQQVITVCAQHSARLPEGCQESFLPMGSF